MPELDEPTPGTTADPKPDDAPGAAASDDPAAGGSAEDPSREDEVVDLRRKNAQLLSEKTKYEAAQREIEDLRRQKATPHPPATGDDAGRAMYQRDLQLEDELLAGVQPTIEHLQAQARLRKFTQQQVHAASQAAQRNIEVVKLPEELRAEAEKLAEDEGISVKLAARILKAERAAMPADNGSGDAAAEEERLARLRAKRDATPATISTPVKGGGTTITRAEYNRKLAEFNDNDDIRGKAEYVQKKNAGKIRVSG